MGTFENIKQNLMLWIFGALVIFGSGVYVADQPVHNGYVEGTLIQATETNPVTADHTQMLATLDNGSQVRVDNLFRIIPEVGKRIKIAKRTRNITGYNEYHFVEYVE